MDIYSILNLDGAATAAPAPWSLVRVVGPDAVEFLHRICSQDVQALEAGRTAPACFLTPKGKLVATTVLARDAEGVAVEVAAAGADALLQTLERFHFTERLRFERDPDAVSASVEGASSWAAAGLDSTGHGEQAGVRLIAGERDGFRWVHGHGAAAAVEAWTASLGLPTVDPDHAECLRLASRRLIVGVDTDDATIALEAPVDDHISVTKGCYTGQEIVARIHTYGHVNRKLVLVHVTAGAEPERGAAVQDEDGDACGRVTTAARLPGGAGALAWAYVPRELASAGTALRVGDAAAAQVVGFGPA